MATSAEPPDSDPETCSICLEHQKEARVLPCIHSFCLSCLEDYCRSNKKLPGDDIPCPECRHEFHIPKDGVAGLTVRKRTDFARIIDDDVMQVSLRFKMFRGLAAQVETDKDKLRDVNRKIKNKGEEVKQSFTRLIDRQVADLVQLQSAAEAQLQSQADAVHLALRELESFRPGSLQLKSKSSPSDVHFQATELLAKHVIPGEYHSPSYTFTPFNTEEFLRSNQNFIGHVTKVEDPGKSSHLLQSTCFNARLQMTVCIQCENLT